MFRSNASSAPIGQRDARVACSRSASRVRRRRAPDEVRPISLHSRELIDARKKSQQVRANVARPRRSDGPALGAPECASEWRVQRQPFTGYTGAIA